MVQFFSYHLCFQNFQGASKKFINEAALEVYNTEVVIMSVVVKAKIKELASGFNVSGDFADALDKRVHEFIKEACARAEANGRKTVMAKDL